MDGLLLQEILLVPFEGDEGNVALDTTGWRMLVGCVMLNQTSRTQVDRVWPAFFKRFPTPESVIFCGSDYFEDAYALLKQLGLWHRRAETIHKLSSWWHYERGIGFDVRDAPGVGEYAENSWKIFVLNNDEIDPNDKELRAHLGLPALSTKRENVQT